MHVADSDTASRRPRDPQGIEMCQKKRQNLRVLEEVLDIIGSQYGGLAWFRGIVRQVKRLAQAWNAERGVRDPVHAEDPFCSQPDAFLRLALTVDMSLSTASYPDDGEVPAMPAGQPEVVPSQPPAQQKPGGSYVASMNPTDASSWADLMSFLDGSWLTAPYPHDGGLDAKVVTKERVSKEDNKKMDDLIQDQEFEHCSPRDGMSMSTSAETYDSPGQWLTPEDMELQAQVLALDSDSMDIDQLLEADARTQKEEQEGGGA